MKKEIISNELKKLVFFIAFLVLGITLIIKSAEFIIIIFIFTVAAGFLIDYLQEVFSYSGKLQKLFRYLSLIVLISVIGMILYLLFLF